MHALTKIRITNRARGSLPGKGEVKFLQKATSVDREGGGRARERADANRVDRRGQSSRNARDSVFGVARCRRASRTDVTLIANYRGRKRGGIFRRNFKRVLAPRENFSNNAIPARSGNAIRKAMREASLL